MAQDLPHVVIEAKHVGRDVKLCDSNLEQVLLVGWNERRSRYGV
jgi:hypothetical protein